MLLILERGAEKAKQVGAIGPDQLEHWVGAAVAA
jgi:hypothetical protein